MANIADTTLKLVFDEPGAAREMNEVLQQLDEKGWNIRLCDLAEHYGIDYEKEHISVRGSVYYFELDDECSVMTIDTESAWCEIGTFQFPPKSESSKNRNLLLILMIFSKNTRR